MTITKFTGAVAATALLAIVASVGGSNTVQATEGFAIASSAFKDLVRVQGQ